MNHGKHGRHGNGDGGEGNVVAQRRGGAERKGQNKGQRDNGGLAGMWFHSRKDGKIEWQGTVLRDLGNGTCLVQLFEWLMGTATDQKVVTSEQMKNFDFYPTDQAMRWAYHNENGGSDEDWENEMEMVEFLSQP